MSMRIRLAALVVLLVPALAWANPAFQSVERRITDNLGDQYDPAISGDLIVYSDYRSYDTDVWYFDLTTGVEAPVVVAPGNQELSDVSGALIVYTDLDTADVVVFDTAAGSTQNLTAAAGAISINPAVGGTLVAWEDKRDGNIEVYARNLATGEERRLTNNPAVDARPAVSGGTVVWERCLGLDCEIFAYDWAGAAVRQITATPAGEEHRPDVSGNTVVYEALRDNERDIYAFDLVTGVERRLDLPAMQVNPNVSGDWVALEDLRSGSFHITLWHLPTGMTFDATGDRVGQQFLNDIDGSRIVYTDDRNGQLDIYLLEFSVDFGGRPVTCADPGNAWPVLDQTMTRTTGTPNEFSFAFAAAKGPGLICLDNSTPPVTAAWVELAGRALVGPGALKDAAGEPLPQLSLKVDLEAQNLLTARLASKPGTSLRVRVYDAKATTGGPNLGRVLSPAPLKLAAVAPAGAAGSAVPAVLANAADVPVDPEPGFGCSQSGSPAPLLALALLGALAMLPRPNRRRALARRTTRG